MTKYDVVYNLDNLVALPDERRRVMDAIEEAQWQDEFEQDDQLSIELDYINRCIEKGDLYAPLF
jgi:hypothetical protein|tara:strand:- start:2041 stop:2232 length:192 start_codon:yes stop_codon:yes gene_type:complete